MKRLFILFAGTAIGLVSVGSSQTVAAGRAAFEQRIQERAVIFQLFVAGNAREGVDRLLALPVPKGMPQQLYLAQELVRLSFEARNAQEPAAAAQAATLAVELLTPGMVARLETRENRAAAWRLRAQIHESILPDRNAAQAAWALVLSEKSDDSRAVAAVRRIDSRTAHEARKREEKGRDPMGPGFVPNPVPPATKP